MGVMPEGRTVALKKNSESFFLGLVGTVVKIDQRAVLLAQCECTNRTVTRDVCIPIEN